MMNCRILLSLLASMAIAPEVTAQSKESTRWGAALGPTISRYDGRTIPVGNAEAFHPSWTDTILTGAANGQLHAVVTAMRRLPSTALLLRMDGSFNRSVSRVGSAVPLRCTVEVQDDDFMRWRCISARSALREDVYAVDAGLQCDALPERRWSPYLLTMLGAMHTRLGWNPDTTSGRITNTERSWGATAGVGFGLRLSLASRELFVEAKRHYRFHTLKGSAFRPIVAGVRSEKRSLV